MRVTRPLLLLAIVAALIAPTSSGAVTTSSRAGGRMVAAGYTAPRAVSDNASGVIVAMRDPSTSTALVNRFAPNGARLWDQGISYDDSLGVGLESDGSGGAIVVVNVDGGRVLLTRVVGSGSTSWQAMVPSGIVAAGGDGGAWVFSQSQELYADGVTASGQPRPRVQITSGPEAESLPVATGDGQGGAYLAWRVAVSETQFGIALQHLSSDGTLWSRAVHVAGSSEPNLAPRVTPDGRGGVLVWWSAAGYLWVADYNADGSQAWDHVLTLPSGKSTRAAVIGNAAGTFIAWTKRLRDEPLVTELLSVSFAGLGGAVHWTRNVTSVEAGLLDLQVSAATDAIAVGWQTSHVHQITGAIDTDLYVARVAIDGASTYNPGMQPLASSLGPEAFGSVVDAGAGQIVAVFTQAPCLRADVSGVAIQRIAPDGTRAFGADGSCP